MVLREFGTANIYLIIDTIFYNSYTIITKGLSPKEGAFIMSAIMIAHYDKGAFYPTGGALW